MIKVVHIHTDLKFISDISRFYGNDFDNYLIIIAKPKDWNTLQRLYGDNLLLFSYSAKSVHKIVELCKDAGLIVFYDLDMIKCKIGMELPTSTKKAWRFFGHELYGRESYLYYSNLTRQSAQLSNGQRLNKVIDGFIGVLKSYLKWGILSESFFGNAINHIDYFLCFSQEEYNFLSARWKTLPLFVRLSVDGSYDPNNEIYSKDDSIVIGNNRSNYNNNLDVIELIEKSGNPYQFRFYLLHSYGTDTNYSRKIIETVKGKNQYTIIDDFMTLENFNIFYKKVTAAVFNGYRQMALGNVFIALKYGVKLYLNNRNSVVQWLKNNDILVYSVDDFSKDLKSGNISLSHEEITHNCLSWRKLIRSYSNNDFQNVIHSLITEQCDLQD